VLGGSFQWELHSLCQKSKGTKFPYIRAEIKHWLYMKNQLIVPNANANVRKFWIY